MCSDTRARATHCYSVDMIPTALLTLYPMILSSGMPFLQRAAFKPVEERLFGNFATWQHGLVYSYVQILRSHEAGRPYKNGDTFDLQQSVEVLDVVLTVQLDLQGWSYSYFSELVGLVWCGEGGLTIPYHFGGVAYHYHHWSPLRPR